MSIALAIVVARTLADWLLPVGNDSVLDESVLPPAFVSLPLTVVRQIGLPLLAGVVGVIVLRGHVARRSLLLWLPIALAVMVPLVLGLAHLLITSEATYRQGLYRVYARAPDYLDVTTFFEVQNSPDSYRWHAIPTFAMSHLRALPVTMASAGIGAWLTRRFWRPAAPTLPA